MQSTIYGTLTGNYISHTVREFTNNKQELIKYTEVTLSFPDSRSKTATFTLSQDSDINQFSKLKMGDELTINFDYFEKGAEYNVTIGDKSKSIWVRKPRLVLTTKPRNTKPL